MKKHIFGKFCIFTQNDRPIYMIVEDKFPAILYKYIDASGGLSMVGKEELWFTRPGNLNDPYDCYHVDTLRGEYDKFSIDYDLNPAMKSKGVCSLCDSPLKFPMWSYYNQHKGVCVGLNMNVVKEKLLGYHQGPKRFVTIRKVKYQSSIPQINIYDLMPEDYLNFDEESFDKAQNAIHNFLSTKALWWSDENEYRLLLRENEISPTDEPVKVRVENLIDSVYLGCKYDGDITSIIDLAKKRKFNVYRMDIKKDDWGLLVQELYNCQ